MYPVRSLICIVLFAACGGDGSTSPNPTSSIPPPTGTPPASATVNVSDNFFNPSSVTVRRAPDSATVTWTWSGGNSHNVTFDSGGTNSATQQSGSFARSFTSPGIFTYFCTIHGRSVMSGTIVVQ